MANLNAKLPKQAFAKIDASNDDLFYAQPRFVTHIDDVALRALTSFHVNHLAGVDNILDLMSSWVSHLPHAFKGSVTGHGMNAQELTANPKLGRYFVQNLNLSPRLDIPDASFDAALCCAGVQYLAQPDVVFAEVARVLKPGAPFIVSFSNRCFPSKAVAVWRALDRLGHSQLVEHYLVHAGFDNVASHSLCDGSTSDPITAVVGFVAV